MVANRRRWAVPAALIVSAVILVGCGDDGDDRTTAGATTTTEVPATSTTSDATSEPQATDTTVAETTTPVETTTTAAPERFEPGAGLLTLQGPTPLRWGDHLDRARDLTGVEPEPLCGAADTSAGATLTAEGVTLVFDSDLELSSYQVLGGTWTTPEGVGIGMPALDALDADARLADVGDTSALVRDGIPTDMLLTIRDGSVTEILISRKLDQEPGTGWC